MENVMNGHVASMGKKKMHTKFWLGKYEEAALKCLGADEWIILKWILKGV
jgi:hypothetical protein